MSFNIQYAQHIHKKKERKKERKHYFCFVLFLCTHTHSRKCLSKMETKNKQQNLFEEEIENRKMCKNVNTIANSQLS